LKKKINQRFSPILRLPPEVTAGIFEACVPEITWSKEDRPLCRSMLNATIPLVIGRVCRAWRDVAWSIPRLWSSLSLQLDGRTALDCVLLEEWISRSGVLPLSIQLWLDGASHHDIWSILRIFTGCCECWRYIYLALPISLYGGLKSIHNCLPLLTTLYLDLDLGLDHRRQCFRHFSTAPQLSHVEIFKYNPALIDIGKY
jgi:hypothetical protein